MLTPQHLRVAAYAVCCQDGRILLAHYVSPDGRLRHWTLPGGKVEHGEDPLDAVVREVAEETGLVVEVKRLLGVDSRSLHVDWGGPDGAELHNIGIFYRARVVGGELRDELHGTTDMARWVPLPDVTAMPRAVVIEVGLELARSEPAVGHVPPVPVGGLVRY